MKIFASFSLCCLCLAGCAGLEHGGYDVSSRKTGAHEYELTVKGQPGDDADELKRALKARARKTCVDEVFLLRGLREETFNPRLSSGYIVLRGQIECVGVDYFDNTPRKRKPSKK